MQIHKFNFYTEFNQFFVEDKKSNADTGSPDFWDEQAFFDNMAIGDGVIGIGTQSYGKIRGEIEVIDKPIERVDFSKYDHIVEAGIELVSGEVQIVSSTSNQVEISFKIPPGKYRVRVYGSNFNSVLETDFANDTDNDFYRIEIWRSDDMDRKVLKRWDK